MVTPDPQRAFLALLEEHRGILYKVARAYGRSDADRDDLAQETVAQLWRSFARYDRRLRFSTWMYRIALNVAISFHRREGTRAEHVVPAGEEMLQVVGGGRPDDDAELTELYAAIGGLDDLSKALAMLYLDGHSHAEIAEVLGITPTNVGTRINRLKERLRRELRAAEHLESKGDDDGAG